MPSETVTAQPKVDCKHCGTAFHPQTEDDEFCCAGCAFVSQLLASENLQRFYDLKGKKVLPPIKSRAFEPRDFSWLESLAREAEREDSAANTATLTLALQGLSCIGCVWLVETLFKRQPAALTVNVQLRDATATISWQKTAGLPTNDAKPFDILALAQTLQKHGYILARVGAGNAGGQSEAAALNTRLGLCGAFAVNAMAFSLPRYLGLPESSPFAPLFDLITAVSATLSLLVGGTWFFSRAWNAFRLRTLHIDLPISLGIASAYLGSLAGWFFSRHDLFYFDFVAIFIFLMLAGRWLQLRAVEKNRLRARAASAIPLTIDPPVDGDSPLPLSQVRSGDEFITRPGQIVPVASRLLSASANISLEWINGEADPRTLPKGATIPAGALNVSPNPLHFSARESWRDSLLQQLTDTPSANSPQHPVANNILKAYLAIVLLLGFAGAALWLANTNSPTRALQVLISLFVVSCPCALGLALPLADDLATSAAEKLGVFIRRPQLWPRLRRIRRALFDKTGTLTLERLSLDNPNTIRAFSNQEKQALWTLTVSNPHPVARSLLENLANQWQPNPSDSSPPEIQSIAGLGVRFTDPDTKESWELRRPDSQNHDTEFLHNDTPVAAFTFQECLRPDAASQINHLRDLQIDPFILSGDRAEKVAATAASLGLDEAHWRARMTPEEKAGWVKELDPEQRSSLYVGDGANDSLAFDHAAVTATPVIDQGVLESKADLYFLGRSLSFIDDLLNIARHRTHAVRRVFAFAVAYNVAAATLALSGFMTPLLAAVLMPLSSIATLSLASATMRTPLLRS